MIWEAIRTIGPQVAALPLIVFVWVFVPIKYWTKFTSLFCLYGEHLRTETQDVGQWKIEVCRDCKQRIEHWY